MEKKIRSASITSLVSFLLILMAGFVQLYLKVEYNVIYRKVSAILGYFVIVPAFLASTIGTVLVIKYYWNNFKAPFKWLYFIIPSILTLLYFTYIIASILINAILD
jgi:hypothetical protein